MIEKSHVLEVLRSVKKQLNLHNYIQLKFLSNRVIHSASMEQDPDIISIAVIIYSLSKLIQREEYKSYKGWPKFYGNYVKHIENSIKYLEKDDLENFRKEINSIRNIINSVSGNLKIYIADVFRKAQINKASKIYEHGISMEKTAKILGISIWELAEYVGQSVSADINLSVTMPIKERIKITEDIFK
jgi:hypothetical protein